MKKENRFIRFELIFFRIYIFIVAFGLFLLSLMYAAQNSIESIARAFMWVVYTMMYVTFGLFIVSVVRVIKYLAVYRKRDEYITIKRSVTIMLTSPIAFGIYLIITLVLSLSVASCTPS